MKDLVEAGEVRPVIDRSYTLGQAPEAIDRVAGGQPRGTIVITVAAASPGRVAMESASKPAPISLPALA